MDFDKVRTAVNSIKMTNTMKHRIIENSNRIGKEVHSNYKRRVSVVLAFTIMLSIIIGIPIFNKNGELQSVNFAITAYAEDIDGNQISKYLSSEIVTFDMSTEDRIGLVDSIGGDGHNLIFADLILNISGDNIDSITYLINKGKFIEDVTLTSEESRDKDWLLSEKIYLIYGEPSSDDFKGIREIGDSYTIKYSDQGKSNYSLAVPHNNYAIGEEVIINVIVKYNDGDIEEQDIIVTQEIDKISLRLKKWKLYE